MREKLVIWGAASQALIVADIIRLRDDYEIAGFLDNINPERARTEFCGASILGGEEQLDRLLQRGIRHVICAIGINRVRLRLAQLVRDKGFQLATAIHPATVVAAGVTMGAGTVVAAGAIVNPGTRIGENAAIGSNACLQHECAIEDGVWINTGVALGGHVTVGRAATVEMGAIVAGRLHIGAGSVVGAGSLVLNGIPENVLAYGSPAKVVRKIADKDYRFSKMT